MTTTRTTSISVHGLTKQFGRIRPVEQLVAEWVIRLLSGPALSAATGEDRAERELLDRCRSTRTGRRRAAARI